MAHRFVNINSIKYEPESDIVSLDFSACRVGDSVQLNGFSETINIPIDIWKIEQSFTFSLILDASTASISETTTFNPSSTQIEFLSDFKKDDNVNFKLMGQYLLGYDGYTFLENKSISEGLNMLLNNFRFAGNISGFSAKVENDSILFIAPDKTGIYYNGFTIQKSLNNKTEEFMFSGGTTTFYLSMGNSNYNLTI